MLILVKARSFFEARMGSLREAAIMANYRVISINSVSFPAEPPPFSPRFLNAKNLLILRFDDMDEGPTAMTPEDARKIVDFIGVGDLPIIVHCSAGISRSGAVGSVLNWYFNRFLADNADECREFELRHPDLIPNAHVRKLLLDELRRRHADGSAG